MQRAVLFSLACFLSAGCATSLAAAEEPGDIRTIMQRAHLTPENRGTRNNLDNKVLDGQATAAEKKELLELYQTLAKAKPPMGKLEDWEQRTKELVKSLQAVYAGEPAAKENFLQARDCKACHAAHRNVD